MSLLAENIHRAMQKRAFGPKAPECHCRKCAEIRETIDRELEPIRDVIELGVLCPKCDGCGSEPDGSDCQACRTIQIASDLLAVDGAPEPAR